MAREQAAGAVGFADNRNESRAKHAVRCGASRKTDNALWRHFFPARRVALRQAQARDHSVCRIVTPQTQSYLVRV